MHPAPPGGRIDVHLAPSYFQVPVNVRVNDQPVMRREQVGGPISVPPGRHTVTCASKYYSVEFGIASLTVDVQPGQVVEVFYAPPHTYASQGAIGLTPQRRRFMPTPFAWAGLVLIGVLIVWGLAFG